MSEGSPQAFRFEGTRAHIFEDEAKTAKEDRPPRPSQYRSETGVTHKGASVTRLEIPVVEEDDEQLAA